MLPVFINRCGAGRHVELIPSKSSEHRVVVQELNSTGTLIQTTTIPRTTTGGSAMDIVYYIDVHNKTIRYYFKDASGQAHLEGKVGTTRSELDDFRGSSDVVLRP
jgi:hypothetical protein